MGSQKNRPRGASTTSRRPAPPAQRGSKPGQKVIREREAAKRALAAASGARAERRRRLMVVLAPIGVVVLAVAVLVAVKAISGAGGPKSGSKASEAAAVVISGVTGVPAATLDAVGVGTSTPMPKAITGDPLVRDGKPRVLYIGAEYCPYCAAERWPMVVALSRFGTWSGLKQTTSAGPPEVYPNTATLTFHGAGYTSDLLSFTGLETNTNQVKGSGYGPLDTVPPEDTAIMAKYNSSGGIPWVDLGGKYMINGATYNLSVLSGKTHEQIAAALADPNSPIAKGVDGAANVITAVLCQLTNSQPSAVCTAPGVVTATKALTNAG